MHGFLPVVIVVFCVSVEVDGLSGMVSVTADAVTAADTFSLFDQQLGLACKTEDLFDTWSVLICSSLWFL